MNKGEKGCVCVCVCLGKKAVAVDVFKALSVVSPQPPTKRTADN